MTALKQIPGARVLFGGELLDPATHKIPAVYGSFQPTAVFVPLEQMMKPQHFNVCTTETFGPFQVVTSYNDSQLDTVIAALEVRGLMLFAVWSADLSMMNE